MLTITTAHNYNLSSLHPLVICLQELNQTSAWVLDRGDTCINLGLWWGVTLLVSVGGCSSNFSFTFRIAPSITILK